MTNEYTIIFDKLRELSESDGSGDVEQLEITGMSQIELDSVAELRRAVTEICEPEPTSFTMT